MISIRCAWSLDPASCTAAPRSSPCFSQSWSCSNCQPHSRCGSCSPFRWWPWPCVTSAKSFTISMKASRPRLLPSPPRSRKIFPVCANHAHTGKIFLDLGGEGSKRGLDAFIEIVNDFAEVTHGHGHHRNGEQDPQREWG